MAAKCAFIEDAPGGFLNTAPLAPDATERPQQLSQHWARDLFQARHARDRGRDAAGVVVQDRAHARLITGDSALWPAAKGDGSDKASSVLTLAASIDAARPLNVGCRSYLLADG